jgi:hypothetical protein
MEMNIGLRVEAIHGLKIYLELKSNFIAYNVGINK